MEILLIIVAIIFLIMAGYSAEHDNPSLGYINLGICIAVALVTFFYTDFVDYKITTSGRVMVQHATAEVYCRYTTEKDYLGGSILHENSTLNIPGKCDIPEYVKSDEFQVVLQELKGTKYDN
jgi:hypothetical protein